MIERVEPTFISFIDSRYVEKFKHLIETSTPIVTDEEYLEQYIMLMS